MCLLPSPTGNNLSIAYSNTSGSVEALVVDIQCEIHSKRLFSLQVEVENPVTKVMSPCAANCLTVLANRLVVAADDGSVRLASLHGVWTTKAKRHFAAVVKVASLVEHTCLLSLGADHRLLLWRLSGEGGGGEGESSELSLVSEIMLTGLGDPQNVSLIPVDGRKSDYLAMVCGSGLQLYRLTLDQ